MNRILPVGDWPSSAWWLLLANLVPLMGVWLLDWTIFDLLLIFWLENVAIGLVNVVRMLAIPGSHQDSVRKLFLVPFFTLHYGGFAYGHGLAVIALFGAGSYRLSDPAGLWQLVADHHLQAAALALLGSHLISLVLNDLKAGQLRQTSLSRVMTRPYRRVVMLHMTILAGGFAAELLGSPVWALVVLIGIKIVLDLRLHLREHGSAMIMIPVHTSPRARSGTNGEHHAND